MKRSVIQEKNDDYDEVVGDHQFPGDDQSGEV